LVGTLRALDRPALVVWGAHDRFVPLVQADRQLESFPGAQVRVLDDSGHYPHLDDPDGVAAVVVPFLQAQVAVGSVYSSRIEPSTRS
jgi:pimeloyl-ACP methyl ester carboxylesterase